MVLLEESVTVLVCVGAGLRYRVVRGVRGNVCRGGRQGLRGTLRWGAAGSAVLRGAVLRGVPHLPYVPGGGALLDVRGSLSGDDGVADRRRAVVWAVGIAGGAGRTEPAHAGPAGHRDHDGADDAADGPGEDRRETALRRVPRGGEHKEGVHIWCA